ncbi:hypothetical protein ABZ464_23535 [Streptomyces sp. NPDC005820]|uniref:hypothetical protein n=1 Tax=Streptomyces sp. NPDC005820 TaxID=3157069 RepID=UPI0034090695
MSTILSVLVWFAELVQRLSSVGWWLVPMLAPGMSLGMWLWLRPTGKHRRPSPPRYARPTPPPPHAADLEEVADREDTIAFRAVTIAGATIASGGGEADR